MTIETVTISNMWEIAAIVELLERKVFCTKQDIYDITTEFPPQEPRAAFLKPPSLSRTCSPKRRTGSSTTFSNYSTSTA
jgi:hypothetical protein